jgi:hypothetical protein
VNRLTIIFFFRETKKSSLVMLRPAWGIRFSIGPFYVYFQELAMTPTISLMLAALVLPGFENDSHPIAATPAAIRETDAQFASLREAREAVTRVLRASSRRGGRDLRETDRSVVATYRRLARSEKIPVAERRLLLGRLRVRLSEQEQALRRREQQAGTSLSGGVVSDAQVLIDLIRSTVAPESWDINGGLGTIYYFPNR